MNPTLTIGIAAYNEEANIDALLDSLLAQKTTIPINEILVVSDASTDKTDEIVLSYKDRGPIRLIRLPERSGQNQGQNRIHSEAKGDVLIILDADMLPSNEYFVEKMTTPIVKNGADLAGIQLIPASPVMFFEKMLAEIHLFKIRLYEEWRGGKNIYMCFGPARGFSKRLYTTLRYPDDYPTDAYSYLFAKREGYTFVPISNPPAIFKVPSTFTDYMRQSSRFSSGNVKLASIFDAKLLHTELAISPFIFFRALLIELIAHPVYLICFVFIHLSVRIMSRGQTFSSRWEISASTKTLNKKI